MSDSPRRWNLEDPRFAGEPADDRRLLEMGIDPDGDPIAIMLQIDCRVERRKRAASGSDKATMESEPPAA